MYLGQQTIVEACRKGGRYPTKTHALKQNPFIPISMINVRTKMLRKSRDSLHPLQAL